MEVEVSAADRARLKAVAADRNSKQKHVWRAWIILATAGGLGTVFGQCMQRHRHQEFLRFANHLECTVPAGKLVHVILDNYGSHKHAKVMRWLARHPCVTFHFTPTSCSWLNAVETFFATLTRRHLKRGIFHSIVALQAAINRYLVEHNQTPKPFVWTADPERIIEQVHRGIKRWMGTTSPENSRGYPRVVTGGGASRCDRV